MQRIVSCSLNRDSGHPWPRGCHWAEQAILLFTDLHYDEVGEVWLLEALLFLAVFSSHPTWTKNCKSTPPKAQRAKLLSAI